MHTCMHRELVHALSRGCRQQPRRSEDHTGCRPGTNCLRNRPEKGQDAKKSLAETIKRRLSSTTTSSLHACCFASSRAHNRAELTHKHADGRTVKGPDRLEGTVVSGHPAVGSQETVPVQLCRLLHNVDHLSTDTRVSARQRQAAVSIYIRPRTRTERAAGSSLPALLVLKPPSPRQPGSASPRASQRSGVASTRGRDRTSNNAAQHGPLTKP